MNIVGDKFFHCHGGYKGTFRRFILYLDEKQLKTMDFTDLVLILDKCKYLSFRSIRNEVTSFKYLRKFGVIESIIKLIQYQNMVKKTALEIECGSFCHGFVQAHYTCNQLPLQFSTAIFRILGLVIYQ